MIGRKNTTKIIQLLFSKLTYRDGNKEGTRSPIIGGIPIRISHGSGSYRKCTPRRRINAQKDETTRVVSNSSTGEMYGHTRQTGSNCVNDVRWTCHDGRHTVNWKIQVKVDFKVILWSDVPARLHKWTSYLYRGFSALFSPVRVISNKMLDYWQLLPCTCTWHIVTAIGKHVSLCTFKNIYWLPPWDGGGLITSAISSISG